MTELGRMAESPRKPSGRIVLLFGKSGCGKSAVAHALVTGGMGRAVFGSGDGTSSRCTKGVQIQTRRGCTVLDTTGLGEAGVGTISNNRVADFLTNLMKSVKDVYSHIIYVINKDSMTSGDEMIWEIFVSVFEGGEGGFVILVTAADEEWLELQRDRLPLYMRRPGFPVLVTDISSMMTGVTERRRVYSTRKLKADLENLFRTRDYAYVLPKIGRSKESQLREMAMSITERIVVVMKHLFGQEQWHTVLKMNSNLVNVAEFVSAVDCLAEAPSTQGTLSPNTDHVKDDLNAKLKGTLVYHDEVLENDGGVPENPRIASGPSSKVLIAEVTASDACENGYFVSSKWLLSLEEHERQFLMWVLWSAGYLKACETTTTTLFAKIGYAQRYIPRQNNIRSDDGTSRLFIKAGGDHLEPSSMKLSEVEIPKNHKSETFNSRNFCGDDLQNPLVTPGKDAASHIQQPATPNQAFSLEPLYLLDQLRRQSDLGWFSSSRPGNLFNLAAGAERCSEPSRAQYVRTECSASGGSRREVSLRTEGDPGKHVFRMRSCVSRQADDRSRAEIENLKSQMDESKVLSVRGKPMSFRALFEGGSSMNNIIDGRNTYPADDVPEAILSGLSKSHIPRALRTDELAGRVTDQSSVRRCLPKFIFREKYAKTYETCFTNSYETIPSQKENPKGSADWKDASDDDITYAGTSDQRLKNASMPNRVTNQNNASGASSSFNGTEEHGFHDEGTNIRLRVDQPKKSRPRSRHHSRRHSRSDFYQRQLLTVDCSSPIWPRRELPQTSNFIRIQFGDSVVMMPGTREFKTISTMVEKRFSMSKIDFSSDLLGDKRPREVSIDLKAIVEFSVSSYRLKINHRSSKIHINFTKISGQVKKEKSEEELCTAMVISSLCTNVSCYIARPNSENSLEHIILNLDDEYHCPPRRRVLSTTPQFKESSAKPFEEDLALVWLEISGRTPNFHEPASTTLALQCNIEGRRRVDSRRQVQEAHPILFQERRPVIFEGSIDEPIHPDSFFKFHIRQLLDISYFKPCTPISEEVRVWRCANSTKVIDFECCLEISARDISLA